MGKRLEAAEVCRQEIKEALETIYNALNSGQQKQLMKNEQVKDIFDRYGAELE